MGPHKLELLREIKEIAGDYTKSYFPNTKQKTTNKVVTLKFVVGSTDL